MNLKFLKDILTDDNGNFTPDKAALIAGVVTYLGIATFAAIKHPELVWPNATNFGLGLGAVLGLGGGGMWLASRQKPTASETGQ